jgi:predicted  nucleic acid-binding Zn-ribbon protein
MPWWFKRETVSTLRRTILLLRETDWLNNSGCNLQLQHSHQARPLEIENLRMNIGQLEKERDLARKRLSESNADLSAQLDKVSGLEKQVADLRTKAAQGTITTPSLGSEQLSEMQRLLEATQIDLESSKREIDPLKSTNLLLQADTTNLQTKGSHHRKSLAR